LDRSACRAGGKRQSKAGRPRVGDHETGLKSSYRNKKGISGSSTTAGQKLNDHILSLLEGGWRKILRSKKGEEGRAAKGRGRFFKDLRHKKQGRNRKGQDARSLPSPALRLPRKTQV